MDDSDSSDICPADPISMEITVGELWVEITAGDTLYYDPDTLVGRQVMGVVNFPPRQIGKFMSEVLVVGASSVMHHQNLETETLHQFGSASKDLGLHYSSYSTFLLRIQS